MNQWNLYVEKKQLSRESREIQSHNQDHRQTVYRLSVCQKITVNTDYSENRVSRKLDNMSILPAVQKHKKQISLGSAWVYMFNLPSLQLCVVTLNMGTRVCIHLHPLTYFWIYPFYYLLLKLQLIISHPNQEVQ